MGAGRPGLQRPRHDRRFPPPGVTLVPSYGWPPFRRGWLAQVAHQVAHAFDHPNAPLSEGRVLAVVVQVVPGNPHWKRVGTDSPSPPGQSPVRRQHRASPPRTARRGAAQEGEEVEGATPWFLALVRHRAGGGGAHENSHHLPSRAGVAPSTVIPAGRLKCLFSRSRPGGCALRPSRRRHAFRAAPGEHDLDGVVLVHVGKGPQELFLRLDGQDSPASVGFLSGVGRAAK